MGFHFFDRSAGGQSKSPAKVAAARRNGKKGGRPSTSTLLERILKRNVTPDEMKTFRAQVLRHIPLEEQDTITNFFQAGWTEIPTVSWRGLPLRVRQAIRHVKAAAKIYPWRPRLKPPKDYVVVRVSKHPGERDVWERRHPNMPFVSTRPKKLYIKNIPDFAYFNSVFARNQHLTAKDIQDTGGGRMTREVAEALLKYLKSTHPPS
jgi:hypothetical protein